MFIEIKSKLHAERVLLSEELSILESYFFQINNEKFSFRRARVSLKIRGHPGGNLSQSMKLADT